MYIFVLLNLDNIDIRVYIALLFILKLLSNMKTFTHKKVTYLTESGKTFKTIAPIPHTLFMDMAYGNVTILSAVNTVKTKYKKYCNVAVK